MVLLLDNCYFPETRKTNEINSATQQLSFWRLFPRKKTERAASQTNLRSLSGWRKKKKRDHSLDKLICP